jgi:hypothetical protein
VRRVALAIGVERTGELVWLRSAAAGAEAFAAWAHRHGYEVHLFTDRNAPVRRQVLADQIAALIEAGDVEQLVIYFSGHGLVLAPDREIWLLSRAPVDPTEAVNLGLSMALARQSGVSHVVFVSDACRSPPSSFGQTALVGGPLFPNRKQSRSVIDVLYATEPGSAAWELPSPDNAHLAHSVFTEALLYALEGHVLEAIEPGPEPPWVVRTHRLGDWLTQEVPLRAGTIHPSLVQVPDVRAESHPPRYLVEVLPLTPPPGPHREPASHSPEWLELARSPSGRLPVWRSSEGTLQEELLEAMHPRRTSSAVEASLILRGTTLRRARALGGQLEETEEGCHAYLLHGRPTSAVVQGAEGFGTVVALVPGRTTWLWARQGRFVQVTYGPLGDPGADPIVFRRKVAWVRALANEAAHERLLEVPDDPHELFLGQPLDPTLGILAALSYYQRGQPDAVKAIEQEMARGGFVPFDIALLSEAPPAPLVAPFCPMTTPGWLLLELGEGAVHPRVRAARAHLIPSLWATYTETGMEILFGEVKP